jgi:hypothetical protein
VPSAKTAAVQQHPSSDMLSAKVGSSNIDEKVMMVTI